jgi:hypothetical protein
MRSDTPTETFKSNTTGIIFSGIVFFIAFVFAVICLASDSPSGPVSAILCVFVGGPFSILVRNYRAIAMYEDRMEVTALLRGTITEVAYADIMNMGFVNSTLNMVIRVPRAETGVESSKDESLILLLYDGRRIEFDSSEYNDLRQVSDFIKQRTEL